MLRMFRTINGQVEQIQKPENGSWLCLSAPTDVELANVSMETGIDLADLRAPLDDEERSRVDVEDDYTMIIVDIPTVEERGGRDWYEPSRCRSSSPSPPSSPSACRTRPCCTRSWKAPSAASTHT